MSAICFAVLEQLYNLAKSLAGSWICSAVGRPQHPHFSTGHWHSDGGLTYVPQRSVGLINFSWRENVINFAVYNQGTFNWSKLITKPLITVLCGLTFAIILKFTWSISGGKMSLLHFKYSIVCIAYSQLKMILSIISLKLSDEGSELLETMGEESSLTGLPCKLFSNLCQLEKTKAAW